MLQRKRNSLEGPHDEAEIQHKALELGLQRGCVFRKGKSAVEDDPRQVEVKLKRREELNKKEVGLEVSLVGIHREKGGLLTLL